MQNVEGVEFRHRNELQTSDIPRCKQDVSIDALRADEDAALYVEILQELRHLLRFRLAHLEAVDDFDFPAAGIFRRAPIEVPDDAAFCSCYSCSRAGADRR